MPLRPQESRAFETLVVRRSAHKPTGQQRTRFYSNHVRFGSKVHSDAWPAAGLAPADDLEIGEVGLPKLVGCRRLVPELVGGLDNDKGWAADQVMSLQ